MRKYIRIIKFSIAFILFLAISCKVHVNVDPEFLIIPGERVGKFVIGEKLIDTTYNKNELEFFLSDED